MSVCLFEFWGQTLSSTPLLPRVQYVQLDVGQGEGHAPAAARQMANGELSSTFLSAPF